MDKVAKFGIVFGLFALALVVVGIFARTTPLADPYQPQEASLANGAPSPKIIMVEKFLIRPGDPVEIGIKVDWQILCVSETGAKLSWEMHGDELTKTFIFTSDRETLVRCTLTR